jgi:hypothetical protein
MAKCVSFNCCSFDETEVYLPKARRRLVFDECFVPRDDPGYQGDSDSSEPSESAFDVLDYLKAKSIVHFSNSGLLYQHILNSVRQFRRWDTPTPMGFPRLQFHNIPPGVLAACGGRPVEFLPARIGGVPDCRPEVYEGVWDVVVGLPVALRVNLPLKEGSTILLSVIPSDPLVSFRTPQLCHLEGGDCVDVHGHHRLGHAGFFSVIMEPDMQVFHLGKSNDCQEFSHVAVHLKKPKNTFFLQFHCSSELALPISDGNFLLVVQSLLHGRAAMVAVPIRIVSGCLMFLKTNWERRVNVFYK